MDKPSEHALCELPARGMRASERPDGTVVLPNTTDFLIRRCAGVTDGINELMQHFRDSAVASAKLVRDSATYQDLIPHAQDGCAPTFCWALNNAASYERATVAGRCCASRCT